MIYQKGSIAFYILVGVVIIASILLTNGVFPSVPYTSLSDFAAITPPKNPTTYTLISDSPANPGGVGQSNLQLRTIKGVAQVGSCTKDAAVLFIVDKSGSMAEGSKLTDLRTGLSTFETNFPDDGILGLTEFSDSATLLLDFNKFSSVKSNFTLDIAGIIPGGGTYTRKAFSFAQAVLTDPADGITHYPGKKFNLVFISDGVPESQEYDTACLSHPSTTDCLTNCEQVSSSSGPHLQCFSPDQDPNAAPSVVDAIKGMGVHIYSIAYLDKADTFFSDKLTALMKTVASTPSDAYFAPDSSAIPGIMNSITTSICQ